GAQRRLFFVDVRGQVTGEVGVTGDAGDIGTVPTPSRACTIRDLSTLPTHDDVLIAGTYPDCLRGFAESPRVATIPQVKGVHVYSGNKLGHACYQLRDLKPGGSAVIRSVRGFEMELQLNKKYLTPLLSSPKDERTGEFRGSEYYVL